MSQPTPDVQEKKCRQDHTPTVKNTFLEFPIPTEDKNRTRNRSRSDGTDPRHSPLVVAAKSPVMSPQLQPVDETMQALPIDEVDFELLEEAAPIGNEPVTRSRRFPDGGEPAVAQAAAGLGRDEPAYVVPSTPSPFLHSAFPPSVVPPFGTFGGYGMPDMGLPPAFGEGEPHEAGAEAAFDMQDVEGQYMQFINSAEGMQLMSEMYDPSYGQYLPYGWSGVGMEGMEGLDGAAGHSDAKEGAIAAPKAEVSSPNLDQDGTPPTAAAESRELQERGEKKDGRRAKARAREGREEERPERRESKAQAGGGAGKADATGGGASGATSGASPEGGADGAKDQDVTPGIYTTVMLRNIPNKYTREMLIKQLSVDFNGQFDFMYLPIDFKNKCNVGYGFINFRTVEACDKFVKDFHGVDVRKCLPGLNSKKVVEVTPARVQGLAENVRRLRNSPVMNQLMDHPEWMPLLFNDEGEEEPFPNPDQPLPPVKPRGRNREAAAA